MGCIIATARAVGNGIVATATPRGGGINTTFRALPSGLQSASFGVRGLTASPTYTPRVSPINLSMAMTCAVGDAMVYSYTPLTFIEATGEQYINLNYVVQEDDIIEMQYIRTTDTDEDKVLFGVTDGTNGIWYSLYNANTYFRFGADVSASQGSGGNQYIMTIQKGSVSIGSTTKSLKYSAMPQYPLYLFARNNANTSVNMFGYCQTTGVKITKTNGNVVMNLKPYKRSDGAVGLLDLVSGKFFNNKGSGTDFKYGGEALMTEGYERIDYLTFNNDKIFDTGVYGNDRTYIELLFKRTDTSGADYIFGCSSGKRLTGYLTTSGYWRYGNGYPTFNTNNKNLSYAEVTPGATTVNGTTRTFSIGGTFTTAFTIPVGGHKPSSGVATATYQGYLYFFRMRIDDEYVVDYMPCKRLSDGVEGLWDCVTQTFVEPL